MHLPLIKIGLYKSQTVCLTSLFSKLKFGFDNFKFDLFSYFTLFGHNERVLKDTFFVLPLVCSLRRARAGAELGRNCFPGKEWMQIHEPILSISTFSWPVGFRFIGRNRHPLSRLYFSYQAWRNRVDITFHGKPTTHENF